MATQHLLSLLVPPTMLLLEISFFGQNMNSTLTCEPSPKSPCAQCAEAEFMNVQFRSAESSQTWRFCVDFLNHRVFSKKGDFLDFFIFMSDIQHCFICRPSDSTVSEEAGFEPRTVATTALTVRRSNHSATSHRWDRVFYQVFLFSPLQCTVTDL